MNPEDFLTKALQAAKAAGHVFPEYAACEAALESGWGNSRLALKANNLFGQKSGFTSVNYPQITLPTHEWSQGKLIPAVANWPMFPDWETCFSERMNLLRSKPIYGEALAQTNGHDFIVTVSRNWATDPMRAKKTLDIYAHYQDVLNT